jgi:DNA repair protein REV1
MRRNQGVYKVADEVPARQFMGHGVCNVHNRSAPLSNSTGGATDDGSRVANAILKLYRSQNFDPKELRGIGIQVQKLESRTSPEERLPGQQALGFISKPDSTKQAPSLINRPAKAAGKPAAHKSRPVFQAVQILPADIDRDVWSVMDTAMQDEYRGGWRMAGIAIPPAFQRSRLPQASLSPRKTRRQREESNQADEIEVTAGTYALEEADLAHAGISAADYAAMDPEVQRELMRALETKRTLFRKGSETPTRMKAIKAISDREIHVDLPTRPTIRMGSTEPLQDLDSVLDGLSVWMEVACKREPNMREVKVLIKYLKRCLDPTTCNVGGVQSAIQALSWWERLCKTKWPTQDSEVGRKWLAVVDDTKGEVQHILSSRYQ